MLVVMWGGGGGGSQLKTGAKREHDLGPDESNVHAFPVQSGVSYILQCLSAES